MKVKEAGEQKQPTACICPERNVAFASLPSLHVQLVPAAHLHWKNEEKQMMRCNKTEQSGTNRHDFTLKTDLLHEAKTVDDFVDAVISILPGVDLHPALPALETVTGINLQTTV